VVFVPPFVPSHEDSYQVLTANAVSGTFANKVVTGLPPGASLDVEYLPGAVVLHVIGPLPGDCDFDGDVDLTDYTGFEACLAGPGGGLTGPGCDCYDTDDNGDVDVEDFAEFQDMFTGV
jgi:hypothetical protein